MRIDQSVINEIKDKTDILDLVAKYVKLEKEDAIISACVLFMMKDTFVHTSEDKQICHCFGCKKVAMSFNLHRRLKIYLS